MPLQAQLSQEDARLYDPNRDVAHIFPQVIQQVAQFLGQGQWPALAEYMVSCGCSGEGLSDALEHYVDLMVRSRDTKESFPEAFANSGWKDVPECYKLAIAATIGAMMTATYFQGARDASLGRKGFPDADFPFMIRAARDAQFLLRQPSWRRRCLLLWRRFKAYWEGSTGAY